MEKKSEADFCGINWKKPTRQPTDSTDEAYRPRHNTSDNLIPVLPLKPLEPLPFNTREMFYDMAGDKLMLIFSHSKYQQHDLFWRYKENQPEPREYTDRDVGRLREVFGNGLGFVIHHYPDEICDQIYKIVKDFSNRDHRNTSCVCVVVLTHGESNGVVLANDQPYELKGLITLLQQGNRWLVGKPKLFIIQACRGGGVDPGRVQFDSAGGFAVLSTHADTLMLTSSVEGYVFWKDEDGSWLIQELCRVVHATHRELDLLQITTMVASLIALERASYTEDWEDHDTKQTPETRSTLTKLLRFTTPRSQ